MRAFSFVFFLFLFSHVGFSQIGMVMELSNCIEGPDGLCSVDLDQDGDEDIVVGGDVVAWFENLGGSVFARKKVISDVNSNFHCIEAADIDIDGDIDLISAAEWSGSLYWFENLGACNFAPAHLISTGPSISVHTNDFDGDGDIDIVSTLGAMDKIAWYENLGGGLFSAAITISSLTNDPKSVRSADFDGDGDFDVVSTSTGDAKIAWYENTGGGVFGPQQVISTLSNYPFTCYTSDLDGDGDKDLLAGTQNAIEWYENLGSGTFGPQQVILTQLVNEATVHSDDLDSDGDEDIVIMTNLPCVHELSWIENLGAGTFGVPVVLESVPDCFEFLVVKTTDIDNNGIRDILFTGISNQYVGWYKNLGGAIFSPEIAITPLTHYPTSGTTADLDNDGDLEAIVTSGKDNKVSFFENLGNEQFSLQKQISVSTSGASDAFCADMDNDGLLDVVTAAANSNRVAWQKNQGGLTFGFQQTLSTTASSVSAVHCDDIDLDGDQDVFFICSNKLAWCKNLGGSFNPAVNITTAISVGRDVYTADIDQDGLPDVLSASSFDDKICWYKNLGGGSFGSQQVISNNANYANCVVASDFDADGDMDVFSTGGSGEARLYPNLGLGVFGPFQVLSLTDMQFDHDNKICLEDFDNDGDPDAVFSSIDKIIFWCENLGTGAFGSPQVLIEDLFSEFLHLSDMDNDNDLDIFTGDYNKSSSVWFKNYLYNDAQVTGEVYFDSDQSGYREAGEPSLAMMQVLTNPSNAFTYTYANGTYIINFGNPPGLWFEVFTTLPPYWNITSDSLLFHVYVDSTTAYQDSLDFGLFPTAIVDTLNIELVGAQPVCNEIVTYWVDVQNIGTTLPSGIINLKLDPWVSFLTAEVVPDSIIGQNIYWHYDSLFYFDHNLIGIHVQMPDFTHMGDTLSSFLNAGVLDSFGNLVFSTSDTLAEVLVCAYDPNDKIATPEGLGISGFIFEDTPFLEYTIRFQNTGTDTATNVVIKDQLDNNLNWTSLLPLASSSPMQVNVNATGLISFEFNGIELPDSNVNEPASHGFVKYRINLDANPAPGTVIQNTAEIYFDLNPAVMTNTKINTIYDCTMIYPSPSIDEPAYDTSCVYGNAITLSGVPGGGTFFGNGVTLNEFDPAVAGVGVHTISYVIQDQNGCIGSDFVDLAVNACLGEAEYEMAGISIYPNPSSGNFTVSIPQNFGESGNIDIIDVYGNIVSQSSFDESHFVVTTSHLSPGIYVVLLTTDSNKYLQRIIVQ